MSDYYFKHKNDSVARVSFENETGRVISYQPIQPELSPFLGNCDRKRFARWWELRSVPASRAMIQKKILAVGYLNTKEYLLKNLALSMTDAYWVCPVDLPLRYEDVQMNGFPAERLPYHNASSYDPNASLGGQMEKYWELDDPETGSTGSSRKIPVLVKESTAHYGQQALNEAFAAMLHKGQKTDIPFVSYRVEKIPDGGWISKCRAFTNDAAEFVPAYEVIHSAPIPNQSNAFEAYIRCCTQHGIPERDIRRFMDYQTLTDFVISNTDEHFQNFGVLRDPDTMRFLAPAPIFDSGNSMFYDILRTRPYPWAELLEQPVTGFYKSEEKMLAQVSDWTVVKPELLPSAEDAIDFYMTHGIPEEKASFLAENYRTKVCLLQEFQRGEKISRYLEKQKENSMQDRKEK